MKTSRFDPRRARDLFEQRLQPILTEHKAGIYLDARNEFYLSLLAEQRLLQSGKHLIDLGAGLSVFGPLCRAFGMDVTLIDDFGGGGGVELGRTGHETPILEAFRQRLGMQIICENFLESPLPIADASADIVTCFHSLEHWHHSPKRLFAEIARVVRPGGFVLIATPNAVNIRKRAYVLLGRSNFPSLKEWYDLGDPIFRGHVREPVIRDLHELMEWNHFEVTGTYGRNFIGRRSESLSFLPGPLTSAIAASSDRVLRLFPSLCSDIHVMARKV